MKNITERVRNHPFFRDMKPEHLDILSEVAKEMSFEPGDILFREGEPANQLFLVESGCVSLEAHEPANGTIPVQNVEAGDVFGWSWLFPPFAWHFQGRAVEPTSAIVLSGAHLLIAAERDHQFGYELMKRVAQILIHRLQATRKQLLATQVESALDG